MDHVTFSRIQNVLNIGFQLLLCFFRIGSTLVASFIIFKVVVHLLVPEHLQKHSIYLQFPSQTQAHFQLDFHNSQFLLDHLDNKQGKSALSQSFHVDRWYYYYDVFDCNQDSFFTSNVPYKFTFHFSMSDSEVNHRAGMFLVVLQLYNEHNQTTPFHTVSRPFLFPYENWLAMTVRRLLFVPLVFVNWYSEAYSFVLTLIDGKQFSASIPFDSIHRIRVSIESLRPIEVIAPSFLNIERELTLFSYLCIYWWFPTYLFGIGLVFMFLLGIQLFQMCVSTIKYGNSSASGESNVDRIVAGMLEEDANNDGLIGANIPPPLLDNA